MRRLTLLVCLFFVLPLVSALSGCSEKPQTPSAKSGYYNGPMTPAGGNAKKKGKE